MNTYHAFYKGRQIEVKALTSYSAQIAAAGTFKARQAFQVAVVLVARDDTPVTHSPGEL